MALKSFVTVFTFVFGVTQRPWRAADPGAREAVGVGSFNLLKREAYLRAGTHRAIRLRPDLVFATEIGTLLNRHNLTQRSFRPLLERAGLPPNRFHDLRHT